jgi:hypothetical protein
MDTNPDVEVADESTVDERLARIFEPPEPEAPEEDTPKAEETSEEEAPEAEKTEPEDEAEEVDFKGKTYRVPKEIKAALVSDQDATSKQQEVTSLRKIVDDKAQYLEAREQLMAAAYQDAAEYRALQLQRAQYENLDWSALYGADPGQALKLRDQRDNLQQQIVQKERELNAKLQAQEQARSQHVTKQMELGRAELVRRVGSITDTDRQATLQQAVSLGFTEGELAQMSDARVMHALVELARLKSKTTAAKDIATKKVQSVAAAKPVSRSAPQAANAGVMADVREKLRKTGRDDYAERLLNERFK